MMAVGRALRARFCDWRQVEVKRDASGTLDAAATVDAAFSPVATEVDSCPVQGVFVHQGSHYTAITRRGPTIYHIDSVCPQDVQVLSAPQFAAFADHFRSSPPGPEGVRAAGLWSVFNRGAPVD